MRIGVGYELIYERPQPTPILLTLNTHSSRVADIVTPDNIVTSPSVPITPYHDAFGNWCSRIVAPTCQIRISTNAVVNDSGLPDSIEPAAWQHPVQDLLNETLVFLLGSRYCDTKKITEIAWGLFDKAPSGWGRVQVICDFVHNHLVFGYEHARSTRTASEAFQERKGVCRDYTHLAITFCRCMNIPARCCNGYLGYIGMPPPFGPDDFAAWFEAYLGGRGHVFDARNNVPRIGRVLIGRGRDATDVPLSTTFGPNILKNFKVWTDEAQS